MERFVAPSLFAFENTRTTTPPNTTIPISNMLLSRNRSLTLSKPQKLSHTNSKYVVPKKCGCSPKGVNYQDEKIGQRGSSRRRHVDPLHLSFASPYQPYPSSPALGGFVKSAITRLARAIRMGRGADHTTSEHPTSQHTTPHRTTL